MTFFLRTVKTKNGGVTHGSGKKWNKETRITKGNPLEFGRKGKGASGTGGTEQWKKQCAMDGKTPLAGPWKVRIYRAAPSRKSQGPWKMRDWAQIRGTDAIPEPPLKTSKQGRQFGWFFTLQWRKHSKGARGGPSNLN